MPHLSKEVTAVKAFFLTLLVPQFNGQEVVEVVRKARLELEALMVEEMEEQAV
jgi:hypothetical protein